MRRVFVLAGIAVSVSALALAVGCSRSSQSPTAPTTSLGADALRSSGTHGEELTAILGTGSGIVNVTATPGAVGFTAQITVNVHGAAPDTDFYVQRAPEIGRANGSDGICQRAAGMPPWGPPAPNFVTFPAPLAGPLVTLHTSAGGAGAVYMDFALATIPDDTRFDVMFRLVDNLAAPSNELRTGCFTVTVK